MAPRGAGTPPFGDTVDFLGLPLRRFDRAAFCDWIAAHLAAPDRPTLVGYVNAATVDLAARSRGFYDRLTTFDCLVADGQSVVWASRILRPPLPERINVTDVVIEVLRRARDAGASVALVGGRPGEAERFAVTVERLVPEIQIVFVSHGYLDDETEAAVAERMRATDPGLVLLGMGAPLQEERAQRWSHADSTSRVWWCVGAVFEYFTGSRYRAPVWVRRAGLEWVVRFAQEPRRLARRYLIGNPRFVWRVLRRQALSTPR